MKKVIYLLLFAASLVSCSSNDAPPPGGGSGLADAATFLESYVGLSTACPMCGGTPLGQGVVVLASLILSADASGAFGRAANESNTHGKTSNLFLPEMYSSENNPFESSGINHNKILNVINSKVSSDDFNGFIIKIENYDQDVWMELLEAVDSHLTFEAKLEAINLAKDADIVDELKQKQMLISDISNTFEVNTAIENSSLSEHAKNEIKYIVEEYKDRYLDNSDNLNVINYINNEIQSRTRTKGGYSIEEQAILGFLSVLKQSTYYWSN